MLCNCREGYGFEQVFAFDFSWEFVFVFSWLLTVSFLLDLINVVLRFSDYGGRLLVGVRVLISSDLVDVLLVNRLSFGLTVVECLEVVVGCAASCGVQEKFTSLRIYVYFALRLPSSVEIDSIPEWVCACDEGSESSILVETQRHAILQVLVTQHIL